MDKFREITCVQVNQGDTVMFWADSWQIDNSIVPLQHRFGRLFSYAIDTMASVKDFIDCQQWESMFHLPLSQQAHQEMLNLKHLVDSLQLKQNEYDKWVLRQNGKQYTAKSYYTYVHKDIISNPLLNWIWASSCTMKIKVFAWMLVMDRLNTQDMLIRRHWNIMFLILLHVCYAQ